MAILGLLVALLALRAAPLRFVSAMEDPAASQHRRRLLDANVEVTSPDVPLHGSCYADIVQHCKHLLVEDPHAAARRRANQARDIVEANKLGHDKSKGKKGKWKGKGKAKGGAAKVAADTHGTGNAKTAASTPSGSAMGAGAKANHTAKQHEQQQQQHHEPKKEQQQQQHAAHGGGGAAAGHKAGSGGAHAHDKAAAAAAAHADDKAAQAQHHQALTHDDFGDDADIGNLGDDLSDGGNITADGHGRALDDVDAADLEEDGGGEMTLERRRRHQRRTLLQQDLVHADAGQVAAGTTGAGAGADAGGDAAVAGAAVAAGAGTAAGAGGGGGAGGAAHVQHKLVPRGRQSVLAELNAAGSQEEDLQEALQILGLRSNQSAAEMAILSPLFARCLSAAARDAEMSISPNAQRVSDECKAEVRSVLIRRASDVRYDPPLLAACAHDIVDDCAEAVDHTPQGVLGCLKAVKADLLPVCRAAVTSRQIAATEDISLDPDLQHACGAERDELCLEAGWGNGAAQECLMGHMQGSLPHVFSAIIFPPDSDDLPEGFAAARAGGARLIKPLSEACTAALATRLIEEGEDIRLNFGLTVACAADKALLCRDVRPGGAAVIRCLEDHLDSTDMSEECRVALSESRQLRSLDVRLDHRFMAHCAADVDAVCPGDVGAQMVRNPVAVPFGYAEPLECLRKRLDQVRDPTCRKHLYEGMIAAYDDNRLDAGLMRGCHAEIALHCAASTASALECLQHKIDRFSREDSLEVLRGKISEPCMSVALARKLQAATDVAFVPRLRTACAREHAAFCSAPGMEGPRALDCLADHRASPESSSRCSDALRDYLAAAASDIRTMAGLQADCGAEIDVLCKDVLPGDGRVVGCLRDGRANITSPLCRRQVLRLLGLMVDDYRTDVRLMRACTADVQQFCAGVPPGDGRVHDCLRRSEGHLSPECAAAEREVEALEHEDVRLNPRLMRECPLAISSFCAEVPPGDARVIGCLQSHMGKGHFPAGCRAALADLTDRAGTRFALQPRLKKACNDDYKHLCHDTVDDPTDASHLGVAANGKENTLACLARQSVILMPNCRAELQSLVKLSLSRYRVGMPLTSQCDGDVMARCQVDKVAAPYLESGFVLGCLAKHSAQLHKPCWELISTMDEDHFQRAAVAESNTFRTAGGGLDDGLLQRVAADVRRQLEPHVMDSVHRQVHEKLQSAASNMTADVEARLTPKLLAAAAKAWVGHMQQLGPKVNALLHTTLSLLMLAVVGLVAAFVAWRRYVSHGGGLLVVRKDGRV